MSGAAELPQAKPAGPLYLFHDLFTGAVSNLNTHTADTGQSWTVLAGGFSLTGSGSIYGASSENTAIINSLSAADGTITWTVNAGTIATATVGGAFRLTNNSNLIYWDDYSGQLRLFKKVAGAYISIASVGGVFTNNAEYIVKAVLLGNSIKIYVNDVLRIDATETFNQTVGGVGLRTSFASSSSGARILDMTVTV